MSRNCVRKCFEQKPTTILLWIGQNDDNPAWVGTNPTTILCGLDNTVPVWIGRDCVPLWTGQDYTFVDLDQTERLGERVR